MKGIHLYTDSFVKDNHKYTCMFLHRQCNVQLQDKNDMLSTKKNSQEVFVRTDRQYQTLQKNDTCVALIFTYEKIRYGKKNSGIKCCSASQK